MRQPRRRYSLVGLNVSPPCIPEQTHSFSLTATPRTDLWRSHTCQDDLKAPVLFTTLRFPFVSAQVTVSALWNLEWDQAGLVLFVGNPVAAQAQILANNASEATHSTLLESSSPPPYTQTTFRWVKIGLELKDDELHASSAIAGAHGIDWSGSSLPHPLSQGQSLRVRMERVGQALWLLYEDATQGSSQHQPHQASDARGRTRWRKMREVNGFFVGVEDKAVRVGVYASRPAGLHASQALNVDSDLVVEFEDLVIY